MQKKVITISHDRLHELVYHDNRVGHFRWKVDRPRGVKAGSIAGSLHSSTGIWRTSLDDEIYMEHRLVWFYYHRQDCCDVLEHINGNRTDNRIENLRVAKRLNQLSSQDMFSLERLRDRLSYDQGTGIFTWKRSSGRVPAGGRAGCVGPNGYRVIGFDGKLFREHRLVWYFVFGELPPTDIDHINGVRDDNRLANLRLASDSENNQNRAKGNGTTSRYMGVSRWARSGRWAASIRLNKKTYNLGTYDTEEEAHAAYLQKKKELHTFQPHLRDGANK